jgi:MFS family permease
MAIAIPAAGAAPDTGERPTAYGWLVFALSFGLLISDYMARQVLNAVFPLLKAEWAVSDGELGWLSGIVALMVGLLTFPLSLLADRWGRVRSLTLMAVLWSLATLMCSVARSYPEMLAGRLLVGVGEAAYGSVGIAVVLMVFPARMRATLTAAFMAGGLFGQVLGVAVGGEIAASYGWRSAFQVIALAGLALAIAYPLCVRERLLRASCDALGNQVAATASGAMPPLRSLFASASVRFAYLGAGLQLYVAAALGAWLPSFFNRYYALPVDRAARLAAVFLLTSGAGMILCGMLSDRLAQRRPERTVQLAIGFCIASAALLAVTFALPPGPLQLAALGGAAFLAASTSGPSGAMVANLTPLALHGTAFATLTLANNLLGLAPGPILTGRFANTLGLDGAMQLLALASVTAAIAFALARRTYLADLRRVGEEQSA